MTNGEFCIKYVGVWMQYHDTMMAVLHAAANDLISNYTINVDSQDVSAPSGVDLISWLATIDDQLPPGTLYQLTDISV